MRGFFGTKAMPWGSEISKVLLKGGVPGAMKTMGPDPAVALGSNSMTAFRIPLDTASAPSGVAVIDVAPESAAEVIFTVGIFPTFPPAVNTGMLQNRQRPAVAVSPPPKFITASS